MSFHDDWLEIPLLLRATLPTWEPFRPSLLVGPSVAFEVGCEVEPDLLSSYSSPLNCDVDGRATTDWSLVMGGGLSWAADRWALILDARYILGLTDLAVPGRDLEAESRAVAVTAGVRIPLGG